eukprot:CAMPEP_0113483734 /NCGR_PEP_ID=MMETSP0014_2-20120614/23586_1 /TAXON_ID=2857 /ORGANISM="Nitzschia sp." /LENGTH=988 /DNA_ID=CAMNT_0000377289 /DNA_START=911 /DNA_END=3877 /DNA_ORIENTATION=+ /assembly_acc=CAM_ASM_000159
MTQHHPMAAPLPPVSSKAKDYSDNNRPTEVTDELDQLRTAGIARVLNRHFTETTKQLAKEKAQADAALADLERRRANKNNSKWNNAENGSNPGASSSAHLHPYDALYMELQQKRAECRRKERETMMLYQRYVMKYGKSAKTAPIQVTGEETENQHSDLPTTTTGTKGNDPPGDSPGTSSLLGTLPEHSEIEPNTTRSPGRGISTKSKNKTRNKTKSNTTSTRSREDTTPVKNFMSALNSFMKDPADGNDDEGDVIDDDNKKKQSRSPFKKISSPLRRRKGNGIKDTTSTSPPRNEQPKADPEFEQALSGFISSTKKKAVVSPDGDDEVEEREVKMEDVTGNGHLEPTSVSTTEDEDNGDVTGTTGSVDNNNNNNTVTPTKAKMTLITGTCTNDHPQLDSPDAKEISEINDDAVYGGDAPETTEMDTEQYNAVPNVERVRTVSVGSSEDKVIEIDAPKSFAEDVVPSFATPTRSTSKNLAAVATVTPNVETTASETAETPPSFATTTVDNEVEIDDRSIISGLTSINSVVTRQVLDDVHHEIEDFIQKETAAIRNMLDNESNTRQPTNSAEYDLQSSTNSFPSQLDESASSLLGDESILVAHKAEAMAREMQRILEDFENEEVSSVAERMSSISETGEDPQVSKDTSMLSGNIDNVIAGDAIGKDGEDAPATTTKSKYPYKFEPAIPGEEWYVYYDEKYGREFFLEKNTNQSQWEEPSSDSPYGTTDRSVVSAADFMSDMHSVASSRASRRSMSSRRSSRRKMYRKKMKKLRRRRLIMAFFALFSVLVCVFHWRVNYPERSFADAMKTTVQNIQDVDIEATKTYLIDQYEYTFTDRKAREEEQAAVAKARQIEEQKRLKALRENKAREEAARKAREEAERRAAEAAARERSRKAKVEADRLAREMAARKAAAKKAAEEAEAARLAAEEEKLKLELQAAYAKQTGAKKETPSERRPVACNIPFAYLARPQCNQLATSQPLFKPEELGFLE